MTDEEFRPRIAPSERSSKLHFDDTEDEFEAFAYGRRKSRRLRKAPPRLFTATLALAQDERVIMVFHASVAASPREVRIRLRQRVGEVGASLARIHEGYDETNFIARSIVAPTLKLLLRDIEAAPEGRAAAGFDVQYVQVVGVEP